MVEPPWLTPYLLVPLNSTVLITCITTSDSPFWLIDLRYDGISVAIPLVTSYEVLNNKGIYEIESPSMPVNEIQLLINDTEKNNQTLILCVGTAESEQYEATVFLYSKCLDEEK